MADGLGHHLPHDLHVRGEQVVPAHPRLPGDAGRHDNDVRVRRIRVTVRPDDPGIVALNGGRFRQIEGLALRNPLHDIDEADIAQRLLRETLGRRGTHIPGADHRNFFLHANPPFRLDARGRSQRTPETESPSRASIVSLSQNVAELKRRDDMKRLRP